MNHVAKRSIAALTTAAGVVALFLWCPLRAIPAVLLVLSTLVQLEFYIMARQKYRPVVWFGLAMGAVWIVGSAAWPVMDLSIMSFLFYIPVFIVVSFFLLAMVVLFCGKYKDPIGTFAVTLAGFFYVPFMVSFFLRTIQTAGTATMLDPPWFAMPEMRTGLYTLFAILAATKVSDMGGFAFGLAFGRHKMFPSVSPKKSWEGFAGSVLGASLVALLFCWIAKRGDWAAECSFWGYATYPRAIAAGVVIATFGTLGDLVESRFKRECGVKDSGTFMPAGMGGFLDMFDSILFMPALAYPLICWAQMAGR